MTNIWDNPDLLVLTGSNLYGCAMPDSDTDLRGFFVEPGEYLIGRKRFEQHDDKVNDTVIWGVRKFFSLLEKGSPNTIEILFAPSDNVRSSTEIGEKILSARSLFVNRRLTDTIRGFASSEWRKAQLLTKNRETGEVYFSPRVVGAKRKDSHAEFGYCLKNAYHSIRLLEEGIELLKSGTITFPRPNANELRNIRNGVMALGAISEKIEALSKEFEVAEAVSILPADPDFKAIDALYLDLIRNKVVEMLSGVVSMS